MNSVNFKILTSSIIKRTMVSIIKGNKKELLNLGLRTSRSENHGSGFFIQTHFKRVSAPGSGLNPSNAFYLSFSIYSFAAVAATAPSLTAATSCQIGVSLQSPAAKIPFSEVSIQRSVFMKPSLFFSTLINSVFGWIPT
jgi:hypothetical protein